MVATNRSHGHEVFGAIPMRAFPDKRLGRTHLSVLGVISRFDGFSRNGSGCYATQATIAEYAGCVPTTVSKRIKDLCAWGYLRSLRQKNRRRIQYRVIYDPNTCPAEQVSANQTCPAEQVCDPKLALQDKQIDLPKDLINSTEVERISAVPSLPLDTHNSKGDHWARSARQARFVPPSPDQVKAYCTERRNSVDPDRFVDFYAAKGWMVGKNRMRDWRAAVRTWEKSDKPKHSDPADRRLS